MVQARLAHARLCHRSDDLTVACSGLFSYTVERRHLLSAPDKLRVTSCRCPLQASPQRSESGHFVDVDRFTDPLDLGRSHRLEEEVALAELSNLFCCRD